MLFQSRREVDNNKNGEKNDEGCSRIQQTLVAAPTLTLPPLSKVLAPYARILHPKGIPPPKSGAGLLQPVC